MVRGGAISETFKTKTGPVHIETDLTLDRLQELIFASDFTTHGLYRSIFTRKATLERIAGRGGSITLALLEDKTIIGYAALDYPDAKERWAIIDENIAMELKAVEVSREHRNHGIAWHILFHLLSDPKLEEKIIYLTAYSWTWDLDFSGLSVQSYRNILITLYTGFGFLECSTNEPNICLKHENIFMVRVGKNVSQKSRETFKWLRFGLSC